MDRKLSSLSPAGAVITAILASICCVGPLVLVVLGVSGAWIGGLRAFEAYRPLFNLFTHSYLFFLSGAFSFEPGPSFRRASSLLPFLSVFSSGGESFLFSAFLRSPSL